MMHPGKIMDIAKFNMGQYRIFWYIQGDNTPEYVEHVGYLDIWKLFPDFRKGRSLKAFYREIVSRDTSGRLHAHYV